MQTKLPAKLNVRSAMLLLMYLLILMYVEGQFSSKVSLLFQITYDYIAHYN